MYQTKFRSSFSIMHFPDLIRSEKKNSNYSQIKKIHIWQCLDKFPFVMETNGNRIGSKTKGKVSAWSYFIWFETKFKSIDFSGCNKFPISCRNLFGNLLALVNWYKPFPTTSLPWWTQISTMNMSSKNILNRNRNSIEIVAKLTYSKHAFHRNCSEIDIQEKCVP